VFRISYNGIVSIPANGNAKTRLGKLCRLVEISRTIECDIRQWHYFRSPIKVAVMKIFIVLMISSM